MPLLTSNLKMAADPPKIAEANCNHMSMESPEDSKPPRYRYSLLLANMAAPEKQAKATADPTNALIRMLHQDTEY